MQAKQAEKPNQIQKGAGNSIVIPKALLKFQNPSLQSSQQQPQRKVQIKKVTSLTRSETMNMAMSASVKRINPAATTAGAASN